MGTNKFQSLDRLKSVLLRPKGDGKMAQLVKAFTAKPDDLKSVPDRMRESHMVE